MMDFDFPDEIAQRADARKLEGCYVNIGRDFLSSRGRRVLAYWDEKRGAADMPDWQDIELMDLWDIAPRLMVKDRVGDDEWRNRYYGTALATCLGRDATGLLIRDYHPATEVSDILEGYRWMVDARAPLRAIGFIVQEDAEHVFYEGVYLPLTSGADRVEKMLALPDYDFLT